MLFKRKAKTKDVKESGAEREIGSQGTSSKKMDLAKDLRKSGGYKKSGIAGESYVTRNDLSSDKLSSNVTSLAPPRSTFASIISANNIEGENLLGKYSIYGGLSGFVPSEDSHKLFNGVDEFEKTGGFDSFHNLGDFVGALGNYSNSLKSPNENSDKVNVLSNRESVLLHINSFAVTTDTAGENLDNMQNKINKDAFVRKTSRGGSNYNLHSNTKNHEIEDFGTLLIPNQNKINNFKADSVSYTDSSKPNLYYNELNNLKTGFGSTKAGSDLAVNDFYENYSFDLNQKDVSFTETEFDYSFTSVDEINDINEKADSFSSSSITTPLNLPNDSSSDAFSGNGIFMDDSGSRNHNNSKESQKSDGLFSKSGSRLSGIFSGISRSHSPIKIDVFRASSPVLETNSRPSSPIKNKLSSNNLFKRSSVKSISKVASPITKTSSSTSNSSTTMSLKRSNTNSYSSFQSQKKLGRISPAISLPILSTSKGIEVDQTSLRKSISSNSDTILQDSGFPYFTGSKSPHEKAVSPSNHVLRSPIPSRNRLSFKSNQGTDKSLVFETRKLSVLNNPETYSIKPPSSSSPFTPRTPINEIYFPQIEVNYSDGNSSLTISHPKIYECLGIDEELNEVVTSKVKRAQREQFHGYLTPEINEYNDEKCTTNNEINDNNDYNDMGGRRLQTGLVIGNNGGQETNYYTESSLGLNIGYRRDSEKNLTSIQTSTKGIAELNISSDSIDENFEKMSYDTSSTSNEPSLRLFEPPMTPKTVASSFYPTPSKTPSKANYSKTDLIPCFMTKLSKLDNWNEFVDEKSLGNLLFFDYMNISTNGNDWDSILCVLFETNVLMINDEKLIGMVSIPDLIKINKEGDSLNLIMTNDLLPELQIQQQELVITKWEYYLNHLIKNEEYEVTEFQLSVNAWDLIPEIYQSKDIIEFNKVINTNDTIPDKFIIKSLPKPDALKLNMIIAVSVINHNTGLSNEQYRSQLIKLICEVKKGLRAIDNLGLIFVGIDGLSKGSFIGCVSSTWEGWNQVLEDIEIFENQEFETNLQELSLSIEKLFDIYPFIPNKNHINKVNILSMNNFADEVDANDLLIRRLSSLEKLSISLIRVGKQNDTISHLRKLMTRPTKDLKIAYGDFLIQFKSLANFIECIPEIIESYQNIVIPSLALTLNGTDSINIDGTVVVGDNITLLIKDILPFEPKNIELSAKNCIKITSRWLNKKTQNSFTI